MEPIDLKIQLDEQAQQYHDELIRAHRVQQQGQRR